MVIMQWIKMEGEWSNNVTILFTQQPLSDHSHDPKQPVEPKVIFSEVLLIICENAETVALQPGTSGYVQDPYKICPHFMGSFGLRPFLPF